MKNNNILILKNIPASIWMYTPYSLHFFLSICSSHSEVADKKVNFSGKCRLFPRGKNGSNLGRGFHKDNLLRIYDLSLRNLVHLNSIFKVQYTGTRFQLSLVIIFITVYKLHLQYLVKKGTVRTVFGQQ